MQECGNHIGGGKIESDRHVGKLAEWSRLELVEMVVEIRKSGLILEMIWRQNCQD